MHNLSVDQSVRFNGKPTNMVAMTVIGNKSTFVSFTVLYDDHDKKSGKNTRFIWGLF